METKGYIIGRFQGIQTLATNRTPQVPSLGPAGSFKVEGTSGGQCSNYQSCTNPTGSWFNQLYPGA